MTLLDKLENYYRESGIFPVNSSAFGCKHLEKCRKPKGCDKPLAFTPLDAALSSPSSWRDTFTPGHSALVGSRYEEAVPRLLFVALDLGTVLRDDDPDYNYVLPENRAPAGIRRNHERMMRLVASGRDTANRPTLRNTNLLAKAILQDLPGFSAGDDFVRFCARVNAVKCTTNKEKRRQADSHLYRNCRERNYLRREINILSPDIIVSQGTHAKETVEHALSVEGEWACEQVVALEGGKGAVWFPSYHPSSYGPYKKQEKRRNQFVQAIRERFSNSVSQK